MGTGGVVASYQNKKLAAEIKRLDEPPSAPDEFAKWIEAGSHLYFLKTNALTDELVIYASGEYSFIYAAIAPTDRLGEIDRDALLHWDGTPYSSAASYVYGGNRDDVWVERSAAARGSPFDCFSKLIFGRTFEGWPGSDRTYFEISQEYAHVCGIHWRPEQRAYCRYDTCGDLEHVVSVAARSAAATDPWCISFAWEPLEEYLAATNSTLIRRFDFTLLYREHFSKWPDGPDDIIEESDTFFFRQKIIPGTAAYTTGVQLIAPRRSRNDIFNVLRGGHESGMYADFIAQDWRNKRITRISTDPEKTTNYFDAHANSLPFELSPAFFRPEVILKYKGDKDKYTVGERDISCRSAWHLEAFDVNDAGQVFAYICYLRNLPYAEQLYWQSFNEAPKAGISERAITNDFRGDFTDITDPLQDLLSIVRSWNDAGVAWWKLRDPRLLDHVATPLTSSRSEWADAFLDLAKLVVEGFEVAELRSRLDGLAISYTKDDKSISLLEKLKNASDQSVDQQKLDGLRAVQRIRTLLKGHTGGSDADLLEREALTEHETYANHYRHTCTILAGEMRMIAAVLS